MSDFPHSITIAAQQLPLIIRKHPRAKHLILRYNPQHGTVHLTLPRNASRAHGRAFLESKHDWLAAQLSRSTHQPFTDGLTVPFLGSELTITHHAQRGIARVESGRLIIPGDKAFLPRRVARYLQHEMQRYCLVQADRYAHSLGERVRTLRIRDTRSRWGSCTKDGALSICWRLAFAPIAVLHYVIAHEVAHLRHHNHSTQFWALLATLVPDYADHETWLRNHGPSLWNWG